MVHADSKPSELDLLKQENSKLRENIVLLKNLESDNKALRDQFQDSFVPPQKLLPARIIGFKGALDNPTTFILDQGGKSGVKNNAAVISGRLLVGKIGNVNTWNSEVILTINKNFTTLAVTESNSSGIITGQEDFILFGDVIITDNLSKGDTVVSRGELDSSASGIPANLIIGKIDAVSKSETKPFQSAIVKSLVNFTKLKTVFVVAQ